MALDFFVQRVYAASLATTQGCPNGKTYPSGILKGLPCNAPISDLDTALKFVQNIVFQFILPSVGVLFTIMLLFGGILYITSAGDPQRVGNAKKTLTAAIIGLLIVTLSYTLIAIFANVLGGSVS
ncbi:MAG: pilin [Bacillota bacterium]|nr:pilin [Bacillota bacterium]